MIRISALALLLASCAGASVERKALIIGIDGLRPGQLQAAVTPHIDAIVANGAVSYVATNAWTPERAWNGHSATNWGVLLTGLSPATTDLTANGDEDHRIDDDGWSEGKHRSLFGHLKRHDPAIETAVFNTWSGIGMKPGTILGSSHTVVDHHFSSEAETTSAERDVETVDATFAALLEADPDVIFLHLCQCDSAGHSHTYEDPRYRAAIENVDALVGRVMEALAIRAQDHHESWLVLITTDHGGESDSTGHGDNSLELVHTIPFIVSAEEIADGADIGTPSLYDVTPTVLSWMGVDPGVPLDGGAVLPLADT
ncbi:MAG: alkaline phosphatase family protein [Planctomycetota bacterium]|nr:alkaline phosphatase family protein [Planctomycetota bacterium]